jgi:hypothetical protein
MASAQASIGEAAAPEKDPRLSSLRARVSEKDEATLSLVIWRDVAIISALLSLFAAAEAWASVSGLALASLLAVPL